MGPSRSGDPSPARGQGFSYVDVDGERLADEVTLRRIADLVIPPAWRDVHICPRPNGHVQAVGTDDAGRRPGPQP